jgi:hypothetical protein
MHEIVLPGQSSLRYLPTYKLSQDHIELFFSVLRQRFGNNNNPDSVQLEFALKRMLTVKLKPSLTGNCASQDRACTSQVSPLRPIPEASSKPNDELEVEECEVPEFPSLSSLSMYVSNVSVYIAGYVGRSLLKKLDCEPCATALFHLDPFYAKIRSDYVLVDEKDNGGLFVPSEDVGLVCKETERTIRELEAVSSNLKKVSSREIEKMTLGKLLRSNVFSDLRFTLTEDHTAESSHAC